MSRARLIALAVALALGGCVVAAEPVVVGPVAPYPYAYPYPYPYAGWGAYAYPYRPYGYGHGYYRPYGRWGRCHGRYYC